MGNPTRLKLLGLLALGRETPAQMAAELSVRRPDVARHLTMLVEAGLVVPSGPGYALNEPALAAWSRRLLAGSGRAVAAAEAPDESERKVLGDFLDADGRLRQLPAQHKKRVVVLRWLADQFQPAVRYPEPQVNELLRRYHEDVASLRRGLVDAELMQRHGGYYWRAGTVPLSGAPG